MYFQGRTLAAPPLKVNCVQIAHACTSQFIIGASLNEQLNLPTNNIICSFNSRAWSMYVCRPVHVCVFQLFDIVGRRHWLQLPHKLTKDSVPLLNSLYLSSQMLNNQQENHNQMLNNQQENHNQMLNNPVTQFHHTHQTARYSCNSDCVTVYTPTLSCSVAMTTWHSVFLHIHCHSISITIVHKSIADWAVQKNTSPKNLK